MYKSESNYICDISVYVCMYMYMYTHTHKQWYPKQESIVILKP